MIEWFANNCDSMAYEQAPPLLTEKLCAWDMGYEYLKHRLFGGLNLKKDRKWFEWTKRHSLRSCREGGLLPDIFIRAYGENMEFSCAETTIQGDPDSFHFYMPGSCSLLKQKDVLPIIYDFLSGTVDELLERIPASTALLSLKEKVKNLKHTDTATHLSWFIPCLRNESHRVNDLLESLRTKIPNFSFDPSSEFMPAPVLMFGTLSPMFSDSDANKILESIECGEAGRIGGYSVIPQGFETRVPYEAGYHAAMQFSDDNEIDIAIDQKGWVDVKPLVESFGVILKDISFDDSDLRGAALAGDGLKSVIFINTSSSYNNDETGRRYTIAHELCHLLYDRNYGREVGVASGPWVPRE